jgi:predicted lipoprotein with Yx(FWY)xxD motif
VSPKVFITSGLAIGSLALSACGSGAGYGAAPSQIPTQAPSVAPVGVSPSPLPTGLAAGITIKVANSRFGQILVDANGRTLYLFLLDSGTTSRCDSAGCVQNWPPVLTHGRPLAGPGVTASLLDTTKRADGTIEVTYAGHPLYYFIADRQPGQVTGQGINAFGAPWYVVSPSGMQIR